ncbi:MAG: hypothetical protein NTW38_09500 [Candidatus Aminicenantes bacterium]|nr:hypothetical protein [Candidatus Aminicenantes bacterium]
MRKKTAFLGIFVLSVLALAGAASPAFAQDPARKILYSLEPGETIMKAESMMALTAEGTDLTLVTTKGAGDQGPFFVFRDGARKGPFADLKDAMAAAYAGGKMSSENKRDCAAYTPDPVPDDTQPNITEEESGMTLQFKGVSLGPHFLILLNSLTPDGARAYITAMDNDKSWLECSDGRKVSFGGTPGDLKVSPDGKNAAVLVTGSYSMNAMNDLGKLPPDKMAAAFKEMDKKYLYTIDGKKFGPFDSFDSSSFWFPKMTNDLYFRVGDQVFRNGAPMMKAESLDPCNFYPSVDGKSYAMFDYSNITFSDGEKYPSPLDVRAYQEKGKTVFKWIALENNKDLVAYQRTM